MPTRDKMARRYDTRTTIFSPEGRLYQVEYAMEAIGHAGTCLGILANDGVLLAAERRNIHKLLDEVFFSEKIYKLNEDMACSVAGITSDANVLTNELRLIAQRYWWQLCVTSNRPTHSLEVRGRSVCPCCTWDGTNTTDSSSTRATPVGTTEAGRPPASATTALLQCPC